MDIIKQIAEELGIMPKQVDVTVKMIDEGNTIPFIARYRKDVTGNLNDEILRKLYERLVYLRNLEEKKQQVLDSIESQGMLTEELKIQILSAMTQVAVDDLYRPYRPKRKTRAMVAKQKGLEPLADIIQKQETDIPIEELAKEYLSEELGVESVEEAVAGACDIIAESISDCADYRTYIRKKTYEEGILTTSQKEEDEKGVFEMYYQFEEAVKKIAGHRILAVNRGESKGILSVKLEAPEDKILSYLRNHVLKRENPHTTPLLENCIKDAYDRLICASIEREIRNELTEKAEDGAIAVFGKNLTQLLLQPPIKDKVVIGWDPAFRTGCKIGVVDGTGKVLTTTVIYPTAPQFKVDEAKKTIKSLIEKYNVDLISVGNGTASRESEQVIVEILKEVKRDVKYVIVNEAGASVYSASELATKEFPDLGEGLRSAVSIARRLQDPLAELVKIDPKSIGVGQYQHDMNQKKLGEALSAVVEDCVNRVGVDLNTASASLLEYVSGISKGIAKNIVEHREENGKFMNRRQLLKVPKLGPKAFEQCAGFLRIHDGDEPLDATGVHPESYEVAKQLLKDLGIELNPDLMKGRKLQNTGISSQITDVSSLAAKLNVGEITLTDIIKELEKPGRDPREDMPAPILKSDVLEMKDLVPGMILKGTVRNVIDFGAFVDIGVHQDGLVHISQITNRFIKHPLEAVSVGDIVEVKVLSVDTSKNRISLTMRLEN